MCSLSLQISYIDFFIFDFFSFLKLMFFPLTNIHLPVYQNLFAFTLPISFLPHTFKKATIWHNFSKVAMRITILKLPFFDSCVVPASSAGAIFQFCVFIDLAKVIVVSEGTGDVELVCEDAVVFDVR